MKHTFPHCHWKSWEDLEILIQLEEKPDPQIPSVPGFSIRGLLGLKVSLLLERSPLALVFFWLSGSAVRLWHGWELL
jgi:hypothetical protein